MRQIIVEILSSCRAWQVVSFAEFTIIVFLLIKIGKIKKNKIVDYEEQILRDGKKKDINMENLMNSIYKSKPLYNSLIRKCHPDRFTDPELNKKATEITKSIVESESNYDKLIEIKINAENELNITI